MRRRAVEVGLVGLAMALGTWFGGWWSIPPLAAVWQLLRKSEPAWLAGLAAMCAWCGLLLMEPLPPLVRLTGRLSGVLHLPPGGALLLTLGYAGLLAWCAARLARAVRR
jgi:hypothetical protein